MADAVLRIFGAIARFHHKRHEDYQPPSTKGMWRVERSGRRKRILTDAELKAIWNCDGGSYGALVKLALLTAQRRDKVRTLRWDDIQDDVWTIPKEEREKGNPGQLALTKAGARYRCEAAEASTPTYSPVVGRDQLHLRATIRPSSIRLCGVKDWRIHDLRRTARSLNVPGRSANRDSRTSFRSHAGRANRDLRSASLSGRDGRRINQAGGADRADNGCQAPSYPPRRSISHIVCNGESRDQAFPSAPGSTIDRDLMALMQRSRSRKSDAVVE